MSAKMKIGIKNRSHRYDINKLTSSHGHKYRKDKNCLSIMMLLCITQQLSNAWSSIHEKVKQHWGLVETCVGKFRKFISDKIKSWVTL